MAPENNSIYGVQNGTVATDRHHLGFIMAQWQQTAITLRFRMTQWQQTAITMGFIMAQWQQTAIIWGS
jgi:hypothetical protein